MSFLKKRNWKTVELDDVDMADFASMGGLEIDVFSDGGEFVPASNKKSDKSALAPKKPKMKKKAPNTVPGTEKSEVCVFPPSKEINNGSTESEMIEWSSFGLHSGILSGLAALGFTKPSPIQRAVIEKSIEGHDVLAAAQTGSGKTLAFGLPILHSILLRRAETPEPCTRAVCVLPTRELALQVKKHLEAVTGKAVSVGAAVGGMSVEKQFRILEKKPDIVVGTPGRLAGLLGLSKSKEASQICVRFKEGLCETLRYLVLDEADRLLEDSHFRDLTEILRFIYSSIPTTDSLQSFIFSATLPVEADQLQKLLKRVRIKKTERRLVVDLVKNTVDTPTPSLSTPASLSFKTLFAVSEEDREPFLVYFLTRQVFASEKKKIIVFVNAISYVYRLASLLPLCLPKAKVVGIHSNLRQKDRLKKLDQFNQSHCAVMVATDLAARGLDLPSVDAVVHLQPPRTPESLIHRSGRTARAGKHGECAMIITPKMTTQWMKTIKIALGKDINQIEPIEISSADLRSIRSIHRLASSLESMSHKERRDSKERAWTKKTCLEADLWDSDASDNEDVLSLSDSDHDVSVAKQNGKDFQLLTELLKNPLPSLEL